MARKSKNTSRVVVTDAHPSEALRVVSPAEAGPADEAKPAISFEQFAEIFRKMDEAEARELADDQAIKDAQKACAIASDIIMTLSAAKLSQTKFAPGSAMAIVAAAVEWRDGQLNNNQVSPFRLIDAVDAYIKLNGG